MTKRLIANFPSMAGTRVAKITGNPFVSCNLNTGDIVTEIEVKVLGLQSEGEGNWFEYYEEGWASVNLALVKF